MIEGSGSGSILLTNESGSGRLKKHVDPVDPDPDSDPKHWNMGYKNDEITKLSKIAEGGGITL
jgi:hypothetical protein